MHGTSRKQAAAKKSKVTRQLALSAVIQEIPDLFCRRREGNQSLSERTRADLLMMRRRISHERTVSSLAQGPSSDQPHPLSTFLDAAWPALTGFSELSRQRPKKRFTVIAANWYYT